MTSEDVGTQKASCKVGARAGIEAGGPGRAAEGCAGQCAAALGSGSIQAPGGCRHKLRAAMQIVMQTTKHLPATPKPAVSPWRRTRRCRSQWRWRPPQSPAAHGGGEQRQASHASGGGSSRHQCPGEAGQHALAEGRPLKRDSRSMGHALPTPLLPPSTLALYAFSGVTPPSTSIQGLQPFSRHMFFSRWILPTCSRRARECTRVKHMLHRIQTTGTCS